MRQVKYLPNYTYTDYLNWEGDWELIDGIPYAREGGINSMSPSAGGRHQWLASLLTTQIVIGLHQNHEQCGHCISVQDVDWKVDENTVLRPDLAIVCTPLENDYIVNPPILVIEIISPSSGHRDRIIKHEIYAQEGVKYYIIADPSIRSYIIYQLVDNKYEEYSALTFNLHKGCTIKIDVSAAMSNLDK